MVEERETLGSNLERERERAHWTKPGIRCLIGVGAYQTKPNFSTLNSSPKLMRKKLSTWNLSEEKRRHPIKVMMVLVKTTLAAMAFLSPTEQCCLCRPRWSLRNFSLFKNGGSEDFISIRLIHIYSVFHLRYNLSFPFYLFSIYPPLLL